MSEHSFQKNKFIKFLKNNSLLIFIILSIVIGFGVGIGLKNSSWNHTDNILWFTLPGKLFIRALSMLVMPFIFIGVVSATSSLSAKNNIRMTSVSLVLIILSHFLGALSGLAGGFVMKQIGVQPVSNENNDSDLTLNSKENAKTAYDIIADIFRNLIPKNIIKATTHQELTRYVPDTTNSSMLVRSVNYIEGTNLLGLLVFAIFLGLGASLLDKKAEMFRDFFKSANEVMTLILRWLIVLLPIGIASLIIDAVLGVENLQDSFKKIGLFAGICVATQIFYLFIVLSVITGLVLRRNPFRLYLTFLEPAILAFTSTTTTVCISKTEDILIESLKIDKRVTKFGIPFFAACKHDGSSLFIVMSCLFLADYSGANLTISNYIVISIMAIILCISIPSVPSASIITILVILNGVNLGALNIAILYTVEWILDRVRTTVNFYSHCLCTLITNELCIKTIQVHASDCSEIEIKAIESGDALQTHI